MRRRALLLALLLALAVPAAAEAQATEAPLAPFIARVGRLWAEGDAEALVELAPDGVRLVLDVGEGAGEVDGRHAGAALRVLFSTRQTLAVRPTRVTIAGGQPLSGFGELSWVSRGRGVTDSRNATVYVGAVWADGGWHVRELRILQ